MSFMAPWYVPVLAAGLTVPPLVLLYFLKLKRQRLPVASTLLWRKAVEDLRVNSPFQRLRSSLLLFLQLLILAAACLAIGEPFKAAGRNVEKAIVLLIDQSASMGTVESNGQTRLDLARQEAVRVVEGLTPEQRAMIIAFSGKARVVCPFSDDKDALRRALDSIRQTDESGKLSEAAALAEAHSMPQGEGIGVSQQVGQAHIILFTDGRLSDAEKVAVQRSTIEVVKTGAASENVGIVDLDVRRSYEQPTDLTVLARVRNFGSRSAARDLSLFINGELKDVRSLGDLTPAGRPDRLPTLAVTAAPAEGSQIVVPFDLKLDTAADVEVRLSGTDSLPADDRAFAVVTAPHPMRVLLVTAGNRFLARLVQVMPLDKFDVWTPKEYQEKPDSELIENGRCRYDVVVFDAHSTDRLPPGNYFFFGGVPLIEGVEAGGFKEGGVLLDWDDTHPILQHVAVESLNLVGWQELRLPKEAVKLVEGTTGPVLSLLNRGRNQYLIAAFSIFDEARSHLNTDWVYRADSVSFMYDTLRFLAGSTTIGQLPPVRPGQPFSLPVAPSRKTVSIKRPDGTSENLSVGALGMVTYGHTDKIGLYVAANGIAADSTRAVSLLDEQESFVTPSQGFRMAGGQVQQTGGSELARRPLWPYFLMAVGGILLLEWIVYARRVYL